MLAEDDVSGLLSTKNISILKHVLVNEPQPHLDGVHTVFGKVIEGMDVVDGIHQGDIMETVEVIEG